jgi:hypothetical protein
MRDDTQKLLPLFDLEWDRPPPRPEQRRPPPRPRRAPPPEHRHRRCSRWNTIGRLVFRAGVSVAATAVIVVLTPVVVAGTWLLIVLLTHATDRVGNPYAKSAAVYEALPPVHTRNHEEMLAHVRQLYPNVATIPPPQGCC